MSSTQSKSKSTIAVAPFTPATYNVARSKVYVHSNTPNLSVPNTTTSTTSIRDDIIFTGNKSTPVDGSKAGLQRSGPEPLGTKAVDPVKVKGEASPATCNVGPAVSQLVITIFSTLISALENANIPQNIGNGIAKAVGSCLTVTNVDSCLSRSCTCPPPASNNPNCNPQPSNPGPSKGAPGGPKVPQSGSGKDKQPNLEPSPFIDYPEPFNPGVDGPEKAAKLRSKTAKTSRSTRK